jgi:flagellar biosynthesis/type III secretory pathway chaperone
MSPLLPRLIETLRHELHQYGEMLALLEQQQESVISRAAGEVLNSVAAINEHMGRVQSARQEREAAQSEIARVLHQPDEPAFASLIPLLPEKFRVAVETLVRENNALLVRVQRRARQNHLLLSRSLEMMQQFMNTLIPATAPTTYNGEGNLHSGHKPAQVFYEGIG